MKPAALFLLCLLGIPLPVAASEPDLDGKWRGEWESGTTGHNGPLTARFSAPDENSVRVKFTGRYARIVPFRFVVDLTIIERGETVLLIGETDLGKRLGAYTYEAELTGESFIARYRTERDQGTFSVTRR
jgi:hypothetical protein